MWQKLLICSSIIFFSGEAKFYKSNVTDFSKCKVYYSRSGSIYKDFFEISEEPRINGSLLDFHFSVMASSDAHILLAPSSKLENGDPVYEIVIGAGGNTFCDIRRMQKSAVKATVRVKGLLSTLDLQSFWIHIGQDGVIEVGKEGEELPILSWTDPDPLPLSVFSFSTWPGVEAKWFFDCPREDNSTTNSTELERALTPLEKLRKDLLFYYDPYVRPVKDKSDITTVGIQISTNLVTLNEYNSVFHLKGTVKMKWEDEKLKWNTSDYDEIDVMHIFRREIWIPNLFLFNAVLDGSDILEDTLLIVNSSGYVNWSTNINLFSWCNPDDLGRWPRDEHSCELVLGFYNEFQNMRLMFDVNGSSFTCPYCSRWEITELESYYNMGWKNNLIANLSNLDAPELRLYFKIRRTSNSYTTILLAPFIGIVSISLLTTFWVSPFGSLKISLACLQLTVSSLVLVVLGLIIPIHSKLVPNIVLLYSYSLVATMFCILIEILVINLSRNEQKYALPHTMEKFLLSSLVKIILCLPDTKSSQQYGNLNESFSKLTENQQNIWVLFGVAIDRIAFFIYTGLLVYAIYIVY